MVKGKVIRVDGHGSFLIEEKEEIEKVDAELVDIEISTEDEIIAAAKDADIILTKGAPFTNRVFQNLPKLLAVVRYGIGYDTVDVNAATDNNVLVVNVPDFCLEEVSNHAITLLLTCAKKITWLNDSTKQNRWSDTKKALSPMGSIFGQTLGLIGCGNIGRMTARKAHIFELKVIGYDPYINKSLAEECCISLVSLEELLKESDYISVHTLLNKDTFHLIGEKEFRQMKPGAYFINTARGQIVDESALLKALQEKWIAGAGLDVFEKEPPAPDNPLLQMENVVITPHTASYSDRAFQQLRRSVGQEAARVLCGRWPKNVVNKGVKPKVELIKE